MATLTGQTIASTYDALLKVTDNGPITSSLKLITDGLGNNTALSLSNVAASINGNVTATSFIKSSGTSTQYLMADGSVSTLTNPITGTGTTNYLSKFTSTSALGNSLLYDDNSGVIIGGTVPFTQAGTTYLSIQNNTLTNSRGIGFYCNDGTQNPRTWIKHVTASGSQYLEFSSAFSTAAGFSNFAFLNGDVLINTTTDSGFNLDVNGTSRFVGNTTISSGALGIGTTSLTARNLVISKSITGSTVGISLFNNPEIASDVTSQGTYYRTTSSTQAASFTLATLHHYLATQGTFGAGSVVTNQYGFLASPTLIGATNNYGFFGQIPSGANRFNLYMEGTAANFLAGDTGIGSTAGVVSSGPILTTTLTNGGSGYVDGTYTDVAPTLITGTGAYSLYTVVVSGGIVTSATLTWGGVSYRVGDTITISNTLLGGTGSGLVITVATVDSSPLRVSNASGGDITLYRSDTSVIANDNIGSIKFEANDASPKASGIGAKISAIAPGATGGAHLSFSTRSITAGTSLVEAMRIDSNGGVGIGATVVTQFGLRVAKNITGSTSSVGIYSDGQIQSGVTVRAEYFGTSSSTQGATFTLATLSHFRANQGTFGASSTVTTQVGFDVTSALIGATNNYAFRGQIASGTNRWNLYMDGTADNYMSGSLGIGSTSLAGYSLRISKTITGAISSYGIRNAGVIQSDVTSSAIYYESTAATQAASFTLPTLINFRASQGTFGATSTVTNQFGFVVDSSLIGATNNYGFYGQIASGTNRWNLYMQGTAANYLNGTTLIGTTTDNSTGAKLQVNGGITYVNIFNRQTASYTLALTDQNDIIEMNVASANNLTIPLNATVAFPIGTEIAVLQYGAGQTTIVATVGVTLRAKANALKISGQFAGCTLVKVGTDEWYVIGDLTA
jgi:hypothetical protein